MDLYNKHTYVSIRILLTSKLKKIEFTIMKLLPWDYGIKAKIIKYIFIVNRVIYIM